MTKEQLEQEITSLEGQLTGDMFQDMDGSTDVTLIQRWAIYISQMGCGPPTGHATCLSLPSCSSLRPTAPS